MNQRMDEWKMRIVVTGVRCAECRELIQPRTLWPLFPSEHTRTQA